MNILQFPEQQDSANTYYGACLKCRKTDGYLNKGKKHWFFCGSHRTRWSAGYGLFSSWQEETKSDWLRNSDKLDYFNEIEPYYGKAAQSE